MYFSFDSSRLLWEHARRAGLRVMNESEEKKPEVINPLPPSENEVPPTLDETKEKNLEGIGGWLILVALGAIITPIRILWELRLYPELFLSGKWQVFGTPLAAVIVVETLVNCALFIAFVALGHKFFTKNRNFPKWWIGLNVFSFIFIVIDTIVMNLAASHLPAFGDDTVKELTHSMGVLCIWVPYMLKSKRVNATFVKTNPTPNLVYISAALVGVCVMIMSSSLSSGASGTGVTEPTVVSSSDEVSKVTAPEGWLEVGADLKPPAASIFIGRELKELYLLVVSEPKSDARAVEITTLEEFSELVRAQLIGRFISPTVSSPERVTINGMDAIRIELKGKTEGIDLFYIHVCVEGENHYHQISAWTLSGLEKNNRPILEGVIKTFKEQ